MNEQDVTRLRILVVDDEQPVRELLVEILGGDHECESADSAEAALQMIAATEYAVVISDIDMPGTSGIDMVPSVLSVSPNTVILLISGNLSIDYSVQAIRVGAFDYITKPFELDFVELSVRRAIDHHRLLVGKKQYETDLEPVEQRSSSATPKPTGSSKKSLREPSNPWPVAQPLLPGFSGTILGS